MGTTTTTETTTATTIATGATAATTKTTTVTEIDNRTAIIITSSRIVVKKLPEHMWQCPQRTKVISGVYPSVTSVTCIIPDNARLLVASAEELDT